VFGPEKFVLPMTLHEALRDDLVALEACAMRLLPRLDASGRQLLLFDPCRHTRKGYTSESMVRCVVWSRLLSCKMCVVVLLCCFVMNTGSHKVEFLVL
jgi:hypothetical protein